MRKVSEYQKINVDETCLWCHTSSYGATPDSSCVPCLTHDSEHGYPTIYHCYTHCCPVHHGPKRIFCKPYAPGLKVVAPLEDPPHLLEERKEQVKQ